MSKADTINTIEKGYKRLPERPNNVLKLVIAEEAIDKQFHWRAGFKKIAAVGLIVVIAALYGYANFYAREQISKALPEPIQITTILFDKNIDLSSQDSEQKNIPIEVVNFIDSKKNSTAGDGSKIIIYEIADKQKDQQRIDGLLSQADVLLKGDKLTSPAGRNAFEKYAEVLIIDQDNQLAKQGLQKIYDRYVFFLNKVVSKGENHKVPGLLNSIVKLSPYRNDIKPLIDKYREFLDERAFINLTAEVIPNEDVNVKEIVEHHISEGEKLSGLDREIAIKAEKLIAVDDYVGALAMLEEFIQTSSFHGAAHDVLLKTYLQQKQYKKAEMLVYQNNNLDVYTMAESAARIVLARDDVDSAIKILESYVPDISSYPDYFYLKAGLYFKKGMADKAAAIYRQLLEVDHDNPHYWLGLAVSMDAKNSDAALQAFAYANNFAEDGSLVKRYIEQRVLVLPQS